MYPSRTLYVGLEGHKESSAVAYVAQAPPAEGISLGNIGTRQGDIAQLIRRLQSKRPHRVFVSEAGPCGSWLDRYLTKKGPVCCVVAPSLSPQKPGDRVNTTRREAIKLARLLRSGDLTPGYVPAVADAAMRDLGRARAEAIHDLQSATVRLTACLRRHDIRYPGRATGGPAPLRWLSEGVCPTPAPQSVSPAYVRAVTDHPENGERVWHQNAQPRGRPGASPRLSRRSRRSAGCTARAQCPPGPHSGTSPGASIPDS